MAEGSDSPRRSESPTGSSAILKRLSKQGPVSEKRKAVYIPVLPRERSTVSVRRPGRNETGDRRCDLNVLTDHRRSDGKDSESQSAIENTTLAVHSKDDRHFHSRASETKLPQTDQTRVSVHGKAIVCEEYPRTSQTVNDELTDTAGEQASSLIRSDTKEQDTKEHGTKEHDTAVQGRGIFCEEYPRASQTVNDELTDTAGEQASCVIRSDTKEHDTKEHRMMPYDAGNSVALGTTDKKMRGTSGGNHDMSYEEIPDETRTRTDDTAESITNFDTADNVTALDTADNMTHLDITNSMTPVDTADKMTSCDTADIMTPFDTQVNMTSDTWVNMTASDTAVNMSPSDTEVNMSPSDTEVNMAPSDTVVNMTPSDTEVNMTPSDTAVNMTPSDTADNMTPSDTEVNMTPSDTEVNMTPSDTAVNMTPSDTEVNMTPSETVVNMTPSDTAVNMTPSDTEVNMTPSETEVNMTPSDTAVNMAPSDTAVNMAPSDTAVNMAPSDTAVNMAPSEIADNMTPSDTAVNMTPSETADNVAPFDTADHSKPEKTENRNSDTTRRRPDATVSVESRTDSESSETSDSAVITTHSSTVTENRVYDKLEHSATHTTWYKATADVSEKTREKEAAKPAGEDKSDETAHKTSTSNRGMRNEMDTERSDTDEEADDTILSDTAQNKTSVTADARTAPTTATGTCRYDIGEHGTSDAHTDNRSSAAATEEMFGPRDARTDNREYDRSDENIPGTTEERTSVTRDIMPRDKTDCGNLDTTETRRSDTNEDRMSVRTGRKTYDLTDLTISDATENTGVDTADVDDEPHYVNYDTPENLLQVDISGQDTTGDSNAVHTSSERNQPRDVPNFCSSEEQSEYNSMLYKAVLPIFAMSVHAVPLTDCNSVSELLTCPQMEQIQKIDRMEGNTSAARLLLHFLKMKDNWFDALLAAFDVPELKLGELKHKLRREKKRVNNDWERRHPVLCTTVRKTSAQDVTKTPIQVASSLPSAGDTPGSDFQLHVDTAAFGSSWRHGKPEGAKELWLPRQKAPVSASSHRENTTSGKSSCDQDPYYFSLLETSVLGASWYHGVMSRGEADSVLEYTNVGTFLVRFNRETRGYRLSLRLPHEVAHLMIEEVNAWNGSKYYILGGNSKPFHSIADLVDYFQLHPVPFRSAHHTTLHCPAPLGIYDTI